MEIIPFTYKMNINENLKTKEKIIGKMNTPGVVRPTLHHKKKKSDGDQIV